MLSQSASQSHSPSPERPRGLELFLAPVLHEPDQTPRPISAVAQRTQVLTPFKHDEYKTYERNDGGLPNQSYHGANRFEIETIWRMLREPAASEAGVLARQEVVSSLATDKAQLEALWCARQAALHAATIVPFLLSSSNSEDRLAEATHKRARNRLQVLVDEKLTCEEAEIQAEAKKIADQPEESRYARRGPVEDREDSIEKLAAVSSIRTVLLDLAAELRRANHQTWREIGADFAASIERLPVISAALLIKAAAETKHELLSDLKSDYGEALTKSISRVTALVIVCKVIEADQFCSVSLNRAEPEFFKRAWNVLKEKGPGNAWSQSEGRYDYQQVMNNSPAPAAEIYLAGSNMSGKSFALDTWFYLRDWGQTFGFIPAEAGNIHVTGAMAFLHRLGSDVHFHERSSFQGEIERGWVPVLSKLAPGSIAYFDLSGDEAFSTTSPVDQYKLLVGLTSYARARGVRVVMAVHNGEFLKFKQGQPDVGLYHFGVDKSYSGRIRYTHVLTEGLDDSHALEVARRMNVPPHILNHAAEFIAGRPPVIDRQPKTPWVLERYTTEERERMKSEALHFRFLWPECSHVIVTDKSHPYQPRPLHWHLDPQGGHSRSGYGEPDLAPNRESIAVMATADNSMKSEAYRFRKHCGDTMHLAQRAGDLIFAGPSEAGGSKEVLERQQLFEELKKNTRADRLLAVCNTLQSSLWCYQHAMRPDLATFPQGILEDIGKSLPRRASYSTSSERWQILPEMISLLEEGLGITFEGKTLQAARTRYERLLPFLDREQKLVEAFQKDSMTREAVEEALKALYLEANTKGTITRALWDAARIFAARADKQLMNAKITEVDTKRISKRAQKIYDLVEVSTKSGLWVTEPLSRVQRAMVMLSDRPMIRETLDILRETDSAYAHGFANYFERISEASIGADITGEKLLLKLYSERPKAKRRRSDSSSDPLEKAGVGSVDYLRAELTKIQTLSRLAIEIRDDKWCKVAFNDTGDVVIKGGRAPANSYMQMENEIPNDTELRNGLRCELLESPNGSGKTMYIKTRIWNGLLALATGYTTADSATMPVFPRIAYLDRVPSDLDRNLSAFGNELTMWMAMPIHFQVTPEAGWLIGVDEAFSSTDPYSQGGLSDAVLTEGVDNGNVIFFSGHNHDWIRSFAERARKKAVVSHFASTVDEGKVQYDFAKKPGGAPSYGLEVAQAFGMPAELIAAARLAPEVSFVKGGQQGT